MYVRTHWVYYVVKNEKSVPFLMGTQLSVLKQLSTENVLLLPQAPATLTGKASHHVTGKCGLTRLSHPLGSRPAGQCLLHPHSQPPSSAAPELCKQPLPGGALQEVREACYQRLAGTPTTHTTQGRQSKPSSSHPCWSGSITLAPRASSSLHIQKPECCAFLRWI